jgi:hypothetical protein
MARRTTVRLPEDLFARAKRQAHSQGRTLTSLIEDGLRLVTAENRRATKKGRIQLPVSKATGGFKPGMENLTFSQLEELEDLEYSERLRNGFE